MPRPINGDIIAERIGQRLRAWRETTDLTLEEVSDRLGMTKGWVSLIERGGKQISLDTLARIANAMSVPVDDLVCSLEPETPQDVETTSLDLWLMRYHQDRASAMARIIYDRVVRGIHA